MKGKTALALSRDLGRLLQDAPSCLLPQAPRGDGGGNEGPRRRRRRQSCRSRRRLFRRLREARQPQGEPPRSSLAPAIKTASAKCVVIVRERDGNSVPAVFRTEGAALNFIKRAHRQGNGRQRRRSHVLGRPARPIRNEAHQPSRGLSLDGACTNWAEEYFSRLRRAEIGHHHHIAGHYLLRYAQEASWREDHRRMSNGEQVLRIAGLAMKAQAECRFRRLLAAAYCAVKQDLCISCKNTFARSAKIIRNLASRMRIIGDFNMSTKSSGGRKHKKTHLRKHPRKSNMKLGKLCRDRHRHASDLLRVLSSGISSRAKRPRRSSIQRSIIFRTALRGMQIIPHACARDWSMSPRFGARAIAFSLSDIRNPTEIQVTDSGKSYSSIHCQGERGR